MINLNERLLAHDASGDWRPLSVRLAYTLLGHHGDVELLVATQEHDRDRVLLVAVVVFVLHGDDHCVRVHCSDVLRSDEDLVSVWWTCHLQTIVDRTFCTHALASTLFGSDKAVDLFTDQWNQAESVRDELIVQS